MEENVCVSVVFQSVSTMGNFILNSKNFENCVQKIDFLEVRIYSQETARMQDFAPFSPELLGALSGPQTPGRKGHLASRGGTLASQVFLRDISLISIFKTWQPCHIYAVILTSWSVVVYVRLDTPFGAKRQFNQTIKDIISEVILYGFSERSHFWVMIMCWFLFYLSTVFITRISVQLFSLDYTFILKYHPWQK